MKIYDLPEQHKNPKATIEEVKKIIPRNEGTFELGLIDLKDLYKQTNDIAVFYLYRWQDRFMALYVENGEDIVFYHQDSKLFPGIREARIAIPGTGLQGSGRIKTTWSAEKSTVLLIDDPSCHIIARGTSGLPVA